jgi:hypothetical protein
MIILYHNIIKKTTILTSADVCEQETSWGRRRSMWRKQLGRRKAFHAKEGADAQEFTPRKK